MSRGAGAHRLVHELNELTWRRLCRSDDLVEEQTRLVECDDEFYFVTLRAGQVRVFDAVCPHHATSLSFATPANGEIECPLHGWRFDIASGTCVRGGRDLVERNVKVENNAVYALCD